MMIHTPGTISSVRPQNQTILQVIK